MLIEKIKERLKAKFPGVNLSQKRIDAIAARLDKRVTEESQIDQALDDANEFFPFEEIAREDDRVRNLEAKSKDPKTTDPPKPQDPPKKPDDVPSWAQGFMDTLKEVKGDLEAFKQGKTKDTYLQRATKAMTDKKIPDAFSKGFLKSFDVTDDEGLTAFLSEVEGAFTELKQSTNDSRFENSDIPGVSKGDPNTVKADIESWAKAKAAESQKTV